MGPPVECYSGSVPYTAREPLQKLGYGDLLRPASGRAVALRAGEPSRIVLATPRHRAIWPERRYLLLFFLTRIILTTVMDTFDTFIHSRWSCPRCSWSLPASQIEVCGSTGFFPSPSLVC